MANKKKLTIADVWDYADPRDVPAYSIAEVAHYLCIPTSTVRSWVSGTKQFRHVLELPNPDVALLSFFNLVEAHALRSLRVIHGIDLPKIRTALDFVKDKLGWDRPLIQEGFKTDGIRLFVDHLGYTIDVTAQGQIVMREVMTHLERIEWEDQIAARLYPFTRLNSDNAPKSVFIDPRFSFGRPILHESRVATAIIADRYKAGDSMDDLALDYGCTRLEIEEAVRCELPIKAAA
ncbi:MAG: DUF433 domain-containing protein [Pirellulaceae bacterium]